VMPCYDKKLEALRPEFSLNTESNNEPYPIVDLVLGTDELIKWLNDNEFDSYLSRTIPSTRSDFTSPMQLDYFSVIKKIINKKKSSINYEQRDDMMYYRPYKDCKGNEESGAMAITGVGDRKDELIEVEQGINKDFRIITSLETNGSKNIKGSMPYGLRNLNNLASYIQRDDFSQLGELVEAMACPSGCTIGGAHASLLDENYYGEKTNTYAYKNNLELMRRGSNPSGMIYCYPEHHPQVTVWNHYRCVLDQRPEEDYENLVGLYSWLQKLPEFKLISLIDEDHQLNLDVDW